MRLNYRRTFLIGFAFFGILLLWQVYDSWCPTFLTDIFARRLYGLSSAGLKAAGPEKLPRVQWIVGILMALDNLAALLLLPLFGSLSDRTRTPIGKRMPYILAGTAVSALAFPLIPLFFHRGGIPAMAAMMGVVLVFMMMYRNPAAALMPDLTPKPLRARANGIINICGYLGGACAMFIGVFLRLSDYINAPDDARNLWIIEIPFLAASGLMVLSAAVLFFTVKENRLAEDLREELEAGERLAAVETPVEAEGPMPPANRRMLFAILAAEFLWFMAENALGTYIGNYVLYYLNAASSATMLLTIAGGAASVLGFAAAGTIADRVGRKYTVTAGLAMTAAALCLMGFARPTGIVVGDLGEQSFPALLYGVWAVKGFGMSLVHGCSFPMVVELCSSEHIGRFTGWYYAASMSAQTVTPVLLGLVFMASGRWEALPAYAAALYALSLAVFALRVKNIRAVKVSNAHGLEGLDSGD